MNRSKTMIDEEPLCCMCGATKFIARVNTGEKYYCNTCVRKINGSEMDYWKPCTQVEFFESMLSHMRKGRKKETNNMLSSLKEQFRQIKDEAADNDKE